MRLARFLRDTQPGFGLVVERAGAQRIVDLARVPEARVLEDRLWSNTDAAILRTLADSAPGDHDAAAVRWLPPVERPERILCVGLNYDAHRQETGRDKTGHPVLFTRFASTLIGHGSAIIRPRVSQQLDFEGELAVVIGRGGRHISAEDALDHVAGYTIFNDASVRDWQRHTHQFTPGKNFPNTGGCGPWVVTRDALPDPAALQLETRLNGDVVQSAPTRDMIFSVPTLIAYISTFTPLSPGDIIATGTPSGVGFARQPPLFMKPGDRIEVSIDRIGLLSNSIADEP